MPSDVKVDPVKIAIGVRESGRGLDGAVMASDVFFPFPTAW